MATAALGLTVSDEAALWWQARAWEYQWISVDLRAIPLENAIARYRAQRALGAKVAADRATSEGLRSAERWWNSSWLPLLHGGGRPEIAIDCADGPASTAPVIIVDPEMIGDEEHASPLAGSLGELVRTAIEQLEGGSFSYDRESDAYGRGPVDRFARAEN